MTRRTIGLFTHGTRPEWANARCAEQAKERRGVGAGPRMGMERAGAPQSSNPRPSRGSPVARPHRPAGTTVRSMGDVRRMGMRGVGHAARTGAWAGCTGRSCESCEAISRRWRARAPASAAPNVRASRLRSMLQWSRHSVRNRAARHPMRVRRACAGAVAEVLHGQHGTWRGGMEPRCQSVITPRQRLRSPFLVSRPVGSSERLAQGLNPWASEIISQPAKNCAVILRPPQST